MTAPSLIVVLGIMAAVLGPWGTLSAQPTRADPVDMQAWYGAQLTVDLPKKWETALAYRIRYQNDASTLLGSYVTTEVQRTLSKAWRLSTNYRLALVDRGTYHRLAAGATWDRRVRDTRVSVRGLLQYQRQTFEGDDDAGGDTDALFRARLQLRRPATAWLTVYASTEPYLALSGPYPVDNWRNTVGTRWTLPRGQVLDLYYIYRPDYGKRSYNRTFHIVGVDLDIDWKPRRKASPF